MLDFKALELNDKERFETYAANRGYHQAVASFANLYIWQKEASTMWAADDDAFYMKFHCKADCSCMVMPFIKNTDEMLLPVMERCEAYAKEVGRRFCMKYVTKQMREKLEAAAPKKYRFEDNLAHDEYIYKTQSMIELTGKKFHGKRNHINALLKSTEPVFDWYSDQYYDGCMALYEEWSDEQTRSERSAASEESSVVRALRHYEQLGLRGCVILIDGKVSGFSVGERLAEDMALIHIEKARTDIAGVYPYLNREFAARAWADCKYINREEDMGIENLRRAKESYRPAFMLKLYDVYLADE